MQPAIHAGFEPAVFRPGTPEEHDLLASTGHLRPEDVRAHRDRFASLGFQGFRDALTPNAGPRFLARAAAYQDEDVLTWGLYHFHCPGDRDDRLDHVHHVIGGLAYVGRHADDIIPFNEPSMHAMLHEVPRGHAAQLALDAVMDCAEVMARVGWQGRIVLTDPMHHAADHELDVLRHLADALAPTGVRVAIGVQHYPHDASAPLADVLSHAQRTFPGLPIVISETGLHFGHPHAAHPDLHPGVHDAPTWLAHVLAEIERSAVPVESVCWFPALAMPPWHLSTERAMRAQPWLCGWPDWLDVRDVLKRQDLAAE